MIPGWCLNDYLVGIRNIIVRFMPCAVNVCFSHLKKHRDTFSYKTKKPKTKQTNKGNIQNSICVNTYRPDSLYTDRTALSVLDTWRVPGVVFIWTAVWWDRCLTCGYWSLPLLLFFPWLSSILIILAFSSTLPYSQHPFLLSALIYHKNVLYLWENTGPGTLPLTWILFLNAHLAEQSSITGHSQMFGRMATSLTWMRVKMSFWRLIEVPGTGSAWHKSDTHCWSLHAAVPQTLCSY